MIKKRFFEILPATMAWATFIALPLLSWKLPFWVALIVILYDFSWFLRIIYLYLHLRVSFNKMRAYLKVNWLAKLKESGVGFQDIYHLVILPMYREPHKIVHETLTKIMEANYPRDKIMIVLATEGRAGEEAARTALDVQGEFGGHFLRFAITEHPFGLPGEIPGKGSNESWAAREAKEKIIDPLGLPYEKVIVSVFDVDTQIAPEYFGRLTYVFLNCKNPQRSSFQPVPLFVNNVYQAPAFSKIISFFPTFWQMMQQSRFEQLCTFSSQAMPFKALVEANYWDTDLVSEDALIFWRFYFRYDGDWRAEPLYYPVSMDANAAPTLLRTAVNLYKQQRRWAWGSEGISYVFTRYIGNKKIKLKEKIFWMYILLEGYYSWATAPFIILIAGWLPIYLGGQVFNATILSFNLPKITSYIMTLAMFSLATSAFLSTTLLPTKPGWFKWYHTFIYILEWALVPVILLVFSAFPAVEAQTRLALGGRFRLGFWVTPKSRSESEAALISAKTTSKSV